MTVTFNHAIIFADDKRASATFFAEIFDRPEPTYWGPFATVGLDEGCLVQFAEPGLVIQAQHYAFLVDDVTFDGLYNRLVTGGVEHWADPQLRQPNAWNTNHGGRGVYFRDPAGHGLEALTRPYGSA